MSLEHPNYYTDYQLYDYLFYRNKGGQPLTEQEEEFCKAMYHFEEYASGLDGIDFEEDEIDEKDESEG